MVRPCVARVFVELSDSAVLHQCMRPLIGAFSLRAIIDISAQVPVGGATQASDVNNLRWLVNDVEFDLRNTLLHNS